MDVFRRESRPFKDSVLGFHAPPLPLTPLCRTFDIRPDLPLSDILSQFQAESGLFQQRYSISLANALYKSCASPLQQYQDDPRAELLTDEQLAQVSRFVQAVFRQQLCHPFGFVTDFYQQILEKTGVNVEQPNVARRICLKLSRQNGAVCQETMKMLAGRSAEGDVIAVLAEIEAEIAKFNKKYVIGFTDCMNYFAKTKAIQINYQYQVLFDAEQNAAVNSLLKSYFYTNDMKIQHNLN